MKYLIYIFIFISLSSFGQSYKDVVNRINKNYSNLSALQLQLTYRLYKGYTDTKIVHEYTGVYEKNGLKTYRKISDAEFINFKDYALKINHKEKVIVVSKSVSLTAFDVDLEQTLSVCKDIKIVKKTNNSTEIILILKNMNDIPYSQVRFVVDKNFWINSMTFYYAGQSNFGTFFEQDLDFAKLEVIYSKLNKATPRLNTIELQDYIRITNDVITPAVKYASYEIINLRKN